MTTRNVIQLQAYKMTNGIAADHKDRAPSSLICSQTNPNRLDNISINPTLAIRNQIINILKRVAQLENEIATEYQKLEDIVGNDYDMELLKGFSS